MTLRDAAPRSEAIAVLFADLRGFSRYCLAEPEAETVLLTLNDWIAAATAAIQARGGVVDQVMGDGLMARFHGARCAADAYAAGHALGAAFDSLHARWAGAASPAATLDVGIGVASGDALLGYVAGRLTAVGRTVNRAARLADAARDGRRLVVDAATLQAGGAPSDLADGPLSIDAGGDDAGLQGYCVRPGPRI